MEEKAIEWPRLFCHCCGKELKDEDECFVDDFLWETFNYIWCSMTCRDNYINSK